MARKNIWSSVLIGIVSAVLAFPIGGAFAQPASNQGAAPPPQSFSKPQLDQMLAPIALYPDSLLAQVLLASTYPSQVVEADRWVKAHRGWSKARINTALNKMDWDLSVKALVPFPKVLDMMDKHLDWTTNLGEAFLGQQQAVMASVQELRHKAYAKGNLRTTPQQKVVVESQDIEIEPTNPEVIYVPYYNPLLVYGPWWWPGYAPFDFFPYYGPYLAFGPFGFGAGIFVGSYWNWGWGHWGWNHGGLYVNADRHLNINDPHAGISRRTMRTANFHTFAAHQAAGLGRVSGARTGAFNRPSAASVRRGISGTRAGAAHGFAHGAGTFRGHGFAGSHTGRVAPGFAGHGSAGAFRGGVGGASHFRGGAAHFGGGASHFRGGAAHFGGGMPHFGGGAAHFGGGMPHFGGGGAHFGGGGAHFGGGGAHFGGGGHGGGGHGHR